MLIAKTNILTALRHTVGSFLTPTKEKRIVGYDGYDENDDGTMNIRAYFMGRRHGFHYDEPLFEGRLVDEIKRTEYATTLTRHYYSYPTERDIVSHTLVRKYEITSSVWPDILEIVTIEKNTIGDVISSDIRRTIERLLAKKDIDFVRVDA